MAKDKEIDLKKWKTESWPNLKKRKRGNKMQKKADN